MKFNRKLLFITLVSSVLLIAVNVAKADTDKNKYHAAKMKHTSDAKIQPWAKLKSAKSKKQTVDQVKIGLFAKAKDSKPQTMIPVNTPLVRIIRQGEWIKVGNQKTGQVGWINLPDYRKAWREYTQPDINNIYVTTTGKDKDINIVAYRNGEKLSEDDAKKLYDKLRKQQVQMNRDWYQKMQDFSQMQRQMRSMMRQQMLDMQEDFSQD